MTRLESPYKSRSASDDLRDPLLLGLVISILVHIIVAGVAWHPSLPPPPPEPIEISIEVPPSSSFQKVRQQIVSPAEQRSASLPQKETPLLSDRNTSTIKEQIHRGDPSAGSAPGKQTESAPSEPSSKSAQQPKKMPPEREVKNSTSPRETKRQSVPPQREMNEEEASVKQPKLTDLALDQDTLMKKFSRPTPASAGMQNPSSRVSLDGYAPFSRPIGSGAQFLGIFGSNDYLPNLPDGDITLLNAKADRFAVFVRRVATRVFSELRSSGWETLSAGELLKLQSYATVRAELSLQGELVNVTTLENSGSDRFDAVLNTASRKGARDPHPPKEAASNNGNIVFIFKARSWVEGAVNRRTGAPMERRWLMLAAGLE